METIELKNASIRNARARIVRAKSLYYAAVYNAVCNCRHKEVGECEYQENRFADSLPPARVCLHCGLMEDGWHCGYVILTNRFAVSLSRGTAFSLRTVRINNNDKGPLLRNEITLEDLLRKKLGIVPAADADKSNVE